MTQRSRAGTEGDSLLARLMEWLGGVGAATPALALSKDAEASMDRLVAAIDQLGSSVGSSLDSAMTQVVDRAGRLADVAPAEPHEGAFGLVLSLLEAVADVAAEVVEQLVMVLAQGDRRSGERDPARSVRRDRDPAYLRNAVHHRMLHAYLNDQTNTLIRALFPHHGLPGKPGVNERFAWNSRCWQCRHGPASNRARRS